MFTVIHKVRLDKFSGVPSVLCIGKNVGNSRN
jgi:hypothetical protein